MYKSIKISILDNTRWPQWHFWGSRSFDAWHYWFCKSIWRSHGDLRRWFSPGPTYHLKKLYRTNGSLHHWSALHYGQRSVCSKIMTTSTQNPEFVTWLLELGNDMISSLTNGSIDLQRYILNAPDLKLLIFIPESYIQNRKVQNHAYFKDWIILYCTKWHSGFYQLFPSDPWTYSSVDATIIESVADNLNMHPIEFLNSLDMAELPPCIWKLDAQ